MARHIAFLVFCEEGDVARHEADDGLVAVDLAEGAGDDCQAQGNADEERGRDADGEDVRAQARGEGRHAGASAARGLVPRRGRRATHLGDAIARDYGGTSPGASAAQGWCRGEVDGRRTWATGLHATTGDVMRTSRGGFWREAATPRTGTP